ncbi:beta-lactamase [Fimbriimonas ginsengisoli Gsoil 348]|uniref:Beta-lactamase n=2 Tax=Fimbriimonas ginsengisoli TaxID=1005039 RepID=A0A068NJN6_FIMGI|nr:beta-lactamase [Fimbriimonas ginsengisoli Gsoil 348]
MQTLDLVYSLKRRFGPNARDGFEKFVSKDRELSNFMELLSPNAAVVRKRAWTMLNTPIGLSGPGSVTYLMALTALVRVEGLAGRLSAASSLASAVRKLAAAPISDSETRYRRECLLEDMDHWLRRFGLSHAPPGRSFRPAEDSMFPAADTRAKREEIGLSSNADGALGTYLSLCQRTGADACLILLRGHLVTEWYSDRYSGQPINIYSSTKSITGLVAAIAEGDGKLNSDEKVAKYLKDWRGGMRDEVTVQDLLDMTAGLPDDSELYSRGIPLTADLDRNALGLKPIHDRGDWAYCSYGVQLLDPILEQVLGKPVHEFARKRLFGPLGIGRDSGFDTDPFGNTDLFTGAKFRARELARIGAVVLAKGKWQGTQVIPEDWIQTVAYDSSGAYSDLFYLDDYSRKLPKKYRTHWIGMRGAYSNNCTIFPDLEMVIVRLQKNFWSWTEQDYDLKEPAAIAALARAIEAEKPSALPQGHGLK